MQKILPVAGFFLASVTFLPNTVLAAPGTTITGNSTSAVSLSSGTEMINSGASLKVSGSTVAITVTGSSTITNNGLLEQTGSGRVIRDNSGGLTLNVNNTGTIESVGNDTFQMNVAGSTVTLTNTGTIESTGTGGSNGQAIDWNALNSNSGSNTLHNNTGGVITAADSDAVRPGQNGVITNDGTIQSKTPTPGTANDSNDGIDAQNNTNITITNANANLAANANLIEGARHGITGGDVDVNITMSVTNNSNGTIKGDDGSGINIDGFANSSGVTAELVTINNAGLIQGDGITGDGDGVDVDGLVNLTNTGTITSLNSVGSSGLEKSEGVTAGGGTITNSGTIQGKVAAGNTTAVGRGITLAGVDKDTSGNAIATQAIYADSVITNNSGGKIIGQTDAGIGIEGTGGGTTVHTVTITNNAGALIQGGGTLVAAIEAGKTATNATPTVNPLNITNSGTIDGSASGKAIDFGNGANSLTVTGGSAVILGDIKGGTGTNTVTIDPGAGNAFSYAGVMSNITSVANKSGTVTFTGANTYSGTTTVSGGTTYLNNATGSGTGTGAVSVTGGTLAGSGTIANSTGVTVHAGGSLASGDAQSGTSVDGTHLTLNNTNLSLSGTGTGANSANLTFDLGAGSTGLGGTPGRDTFDTPNNNTTYLSLTGSSSINFAGTESVSLVDLTNGGLSLTLATPYLLVHAGSNADYLGLVTVSGFGPNSVYTLDGNGYVVGVATGNGVLGTAGSYTPIAITEYGADGVTLLSGSKVYGSPVLYLDNGNLEVVPEPSTWAMMLGGVALVVFMQIRRRRV